MAYGFNNDKSKVDIKTFVRDVFYPVGSIYMSVNSVNPGDLFGGTWESWGSGRVPVGVDIADTSFNSPEKTGGEKTHTLTVSEMPMHNHFPSGKQTYIGRNFSMKTAANGLEVSVMEGYEAVTAQDKGSGSAHNNLQPYITCYMWKRTE